MYWAKLNDGRRVIVSPSKNPTRMVRGEEHFVDQHHTAVLLDGGWQVVRKERIKPAEYGSPFGALDKETQ